MAGASGPHPDAAGLGRNLRRWRGVLPAKVGRRKRFAPFESRKGCGTRAPSRFAEALSLAHPAAFHKTCR